MNLCMRQKPATPRKLNPRSPLYRSFRESLYPRNIPAMYMYGQEHMTEGASNGGNHSSCKFAEHDLIWKTAKWVLIELRASLIALTVHFQ